MKSLLGLLKNYKKFLFFIFLLLIVQIFANLLLPSLMSNIINLGIINHDIPYIINTGLFMLVIALAGSVATLFVGFISAKVSSKIGKNLRFSVFKKAESLSHTNFEELGSSSLITRTTSDITQVTTFILMLLRIVLSAPLMLVGAVIMALSKSPSMSTVLLVSAPVLILSILLIAKTGFSLFGTVQQKVDGINQISREKLTGLRVIRAFTKDTYEKNRFDLRNLDLSDLSIKVNRIVGSLQPIMVLIFNLTTVAVIYIGAQQIDMNVIQVGDLMAFIQYVQQIMMSFIMVSFLFVMMPRALVSMGRINEVLNAKDTMEQSKNPVATKVTKGTIAFEDVSFAFADASEHVLNHLNFTIEPGKITAFIGSTGSGKSTLIRLLPRLFDVSEGRITVDGVNIKDFDVTGLRDGISTVPQKSMLFSGTVKSNLDYARKDASEEEMVQALKIADAYDFIMKKEGLDTPVSQGGTNFSGGQRQRLCIARAVLKNSPILMFDDSFSALDYKTDIKVRKALMEISQDKSIIIVAQRISTIMHADKIIVLDSGNMMGEGTHEELLKSCSVYKEIADSQLTKEVQE